MTPLNSIYRGAPGSSRCFSCNLGCNDEVLPAILITKPKIGFTWSKIADQSFRRGYCHGKNRIPSLFGAERSRRSNAHCRKTCVTLADDEARVDGFPEYRVHRLLFLPVHQGQRCPYNASL